MSKALTPRDFRMFYLKLVIVLACYFTILAFLDVVFNG